MSLWLLNIFFAADGDNNDNDDDDVVIHLFVTYIFSVQASRGLFSSVSMYFLYELP